jgi:signal transduction histidine kinase
MTPRPYSISARLTRMNLAVSGVVLVIAALAFFSYDLLSFRRELIRNLTAEAQIIGDNSVSALLFNDPQSAVMTLRGLQRSPDVLAATLSAKEGSIFARYGAGSDDLSVGHPLAPGETDRFWSSENGVVVAHRIVFQDKSVGVIYISAKLTAVGRRARQYVLIASLILIFCMVAAIVISASSRRFIAEPIRALAQTALSVSTDRDYSVRATTPANSREIAVLVDAFNTMLAQIQEQDAALRQARTHLELRVEQRTAELRQANQELEAFSYTVAHDLRNPLTAIDSVGYLLEISLSDTETSEIHKMIENLRLTTKGMALLIDSLLDFARATSTPLRSDSVNLSLLAREIAAELVSGEPSRIVEFVIEESPEVQADANLMRVVIDNLLRNAWKYTSRHPKARIEFGSQKTIRANGGLDGLVYYVRDDGAGFDPELRQSLFQPFKRLHAKTDFPGTGIGLATVHRIITRHEGTIWAEGEVEKGATFYWTLFRHSAE